MVEGVSRGATRPGRQPWTVTRPARRRQHRMVEVGATWLVVGGAGSGEPPPRHLRRHQTVTERDSGRVRSSVAPAVLFPVRRLKRAVWRGRDPPTNRGPRIITKCRWRTRRLHQPACRRALHIRTVHRQPRAPTGPTKSQRSGPRDVAPGPLFWSLACAPACHGVRRAGGDERAYSRKRAAAFSSVMRFSGWAIGCPSCSKKSARS
jgi:hypothetical protein